MNAPESVESKMILSNMTLKECEAAAKRHERVARKFERQYPGSRPAWVSAEIGNAEAWADAYRAQAKLIKEGESAQKVSVDLRE